MADHNVDEIKVKVRVIEEEEPLGKLFRIFLWMERWKGYFLHVITCFFSRRSGFQLVTKFQS